MSTLVIRAASHLSPAGHGNHRTGLRPWPAEFQTSLEQGDLENLQWSWLFSSDAQRFARMDWLSRIGLLAVELLEANFDQADPALRERTGVCLESCTGCLTTDARFLDTPRPSLFTYTLPSTLLGEICIRHRLKGPQLCLLTADGSGAQALSEAADWLETGAADTAVCLCAEALSADGSTALPPAPNGLPWPAWRADALLLGRGEAPSGSVAAHGSVTALCRKLCIDKPSS